MWRRRLFLERLELAGHFFLALEQCGHLQLQALNRTLLCHALGIDLSHLFRLGQDYCRLNVLHLDGDAWRVDAVNCAPVAPWRFPGP